MDKETLINTLKELHINTSLLKIEDNDNIVLRYDKEYIKRDEINKLFHCVKDMFPDNKVLAIPNSVNIQNLGNTEIIDIINMLKKMLEE